MYSGCHLVLLQHRPCWTLSKTFFLNIVTNLVRIFNKPAKIDIWKSGESSMHLPQFTYIFLYNFQKEGLRQRRHNHHNVLSWIVPNAEGSSEGIQRHGHDKKKLGEPIGAYLSVTGAYLSVTVELKIISL